MLEKILAALVLAACVAMVLRMALPARHQRRLDAGLRSAWLSTRRLGWQAWHWRRWRRHSAQTAEEAIERARRRGEWDGNVYKSKGFKGPRKPH